MSYKGTVTVEVLSVDDVPEADFHGGSDPYVSVKVGGKEQKTTAKENDLNPVYNECFNLFYFFPLYISL